MAFFGRRIDRRNGIWISLVVLAVPTSLLAFTHDLTVFTLLRVAQGLCMATAFTLTMSYLAEHFEPRATTGALAAYVTGNVASNFFGRLLSASLADTFGLSPTFLVFAVLNVAGGVLVLSTLKATERMMGAGGGTTPRRDWRECLGNPALRWSFLIGFLVLFVFIPPAGQLIDHGHGESRCCAHVAYTRQTHLVCWHLLHCGSGFASAGTGRAVGRSVGRYIVASGRYGCAEAART